MLRKGQIWISAVIYVLVISSTLLIVLKFGVPIIDEMKDRNVFEKSKTMMSALDEQILQVANEGEGSQRVVSLDIIEGNLYVENNEIVWEFETNNEVFNTRSSNTQGNLQIVSNSNVKTTELGNSYILSTIVDYSNGFPITFNATIKKFGDISNWTSVNTSELIENLTYDNVSSTGTFNIFLNDDSLTGIGNGYTYMLPSGNNSNLGDATVVAHINSSSFEYDVYITLNSYSDFLVIETKNINVK